MRKGLELRVLQIKGVVAARRTWRSYEAWCARTGRSPQPRYGTVAGYLCEYVARLQGSTRSVAQIKSHLKKMATLNKFAWLSPRSVLKLGALMRQMRYEDPTSARRMAPMLTRMLNKVLSTWDLANPATLVQATLAKTAQQGLLRGGEATCGLQGSDVSWRARRRRAIMHFLRTKRGRTGAGQFVTVAQVDKDPFSAVRLLRRLWRVLELDDHPARFVFPAVRAGRIDLTRPFSAQALRALVKRIASEGGADPAAFANHSLRAGGTTDLLAAGVSETVVQKMGRWKSDTFKIYFRDDVLVANEAARGFVRAVFGALRGVRRELREEYHKQAGRNGGGVRR